VLCESRDHYGTLDFDFLEIDLDADVRWKRLHVNPNNHAVGLGAGRGFLPKL